MRPKKPFSASRRSFVSVFVFGTLTLLLFAAVAVYFINEEKADAELSVIAPERPAHTASPNTAVHFPRSSLTAAPVGTAPPRAVLERYKSLYEKNSDLAGWIYIENTRIDYPVMFTPDEPDLYLHTGFDGEYEYRGLPFLDYRSDMEDVNSNLIIYGHNMKSGSMFHSLLDYSDKDFYLSHQYITLDTLYEARTYRVFAACRTRIPSAQSEEFRYYRHTAFSSSQDFYYYVNNITALSLHAPVFYPTYGAQLLTLSTCAYHEDDGRFIVVAQRVE